MLPKKQHLRLQLLRHNSLTVDRAPSSSGGARFLLFNYPKYFHIVSALNYSILAIDTAFDICSVAILTPTVSGIRTGDQKRKHADDVLVMLQSLLQSEQLSLSDFDAIAMTSGPGSFTGLRIGTAVVQGLAFGSQRPVVCISSLAALAEAAVRIHADSTPASIVATCIHAREEEYYFAVYQKSADGIPASLAKDCIATPSQIRDLLAQHAGDNTALAVGEGWVHPLMQDIASSFGLISVTASYDAQILASMAQYELAAGHAVSAEQAAPVYLKDDLEYRTV